MKDRRFCWGCKKEVRLKTKDPSGRFPVIKQARVWHPECYDAQSSARMTPRPSLGRLARRARPEDLYE